MLFFNTSNGIHTLFFCSKYSIFVFDQQDLKEVLRDLVPKEQKRVAAFKAANKDAPIGQVTIDMVRCKEKCSYFF